MLSTSVFNRSVDKRAKSCEFQRWGGRFAASASDPCPIILKRRSEMAAGTTDNFSRGSDDDSWYPRADDLTKSNVARLVRELKLDDFDALYRFSIERPGDYWRAVSQFCGIVWTKDF